MPLKFDIADDRHAIIEFQANLRFVTPLDPNGLAEVAATLEKVASQRNLPAKIVLPTFTFEIGGGPSISPPSNNFGHQRFAPDGKVDERIAADANSITFLSREYAGWASVRTVLSDYFGEVGRPFFKRSQLVAALHLQYVNEFYSIDAGYHEVSEIFRNDSRWVSGIAKDSPDLWHSHVGQYIPNDRCKDLVNVNADIVLAVAPGGARDFTQARLTIVSAKQFDVPGGKPFVLLPEEAAEQIGLLLDEVHALEKEVLRSTLSDSYLAKVHA